MKKLALVNRDDRCFPATCFPTRGMQMQKLAMRGNITQGQQALQSESQSRLRQRRDQFLVNNVVPEVSGQQAN